jgi:hypothetical protein
MPNIATIVIGLLVLCLFIAAGYFTVKSLRKGDCGGCNECSKNCGEGCNSKDCKK